VAPSRIFADTMLAGQVVLVTGGGTGLGKAAARELHACGATVAIAGRRQEVLEAALPLIGERAFAVPGDIREPDGAAAIVDAVLERGGRLDALVNNAGGQYFAPAEAIEPKGWRAVFNLNVGGTLNMSRAAADRAMRPAGRGAIVNVTLSPHHGLTGMVHSSAARAATEGLTRELAAELGPDGIAVVAAAAGHFDTESLRKYPEVVWKAAAGTVPLQRLGTEQEWGELIAMLAGPLGQTLTGSVVTLDGARDNWYGSWPPSGLRTDEGRVPTEARRPAPG
jgi:citronellol/citronellal dehydrogenase